MTIKAVGITNLSDARYFAAQGATQLHFDFRETSAAFISVQQAREIMNWVSGIRFIGEWATSDVSVLNDYLHDTQLKAVQISEDFPTEHIAHIDAEIVFRKMVINKHTTLDALPPGFS